ncbi:MAG: aldo/keto reductase [Planctomycetota bacterium]|nr:aldo/keto reductase [Planctomycetota bacterium]
MKTRVLGKTGARVSEVGLGTWQLGGADWGALSDDDALRILHRSADLGVNLYDTADVYGSGRSESILSRFLKEKRGGACIATKLGRRGDAPYGWPQNFTLDFARRQTQESMRRLGVNSIFLQQWHCIPTDQLRRGEVFDHLRTLKKEGLIQHWGVSVESVEEGLLCMAQDDCATLQVIYNIFRQKLTTELIPQAKAKNVGILARVPLASGLLAGAFKPGHRFDAKDHRHYNADGKAFNVGETFAGVPFEKGVEIAEQVRQIFQADQAGHSHGGATMAQMSLRWVLDDAGVSSVIPGASRVAQAESNASASLLPPLSAEAHRWLRDLYESRIKPAIRGPY